MVLALFICTQFAKLYVTQLTTPTFICFRVIIMTTFITTMITIIITITINIIRNSITIVITIKPHARHAPASVLLLLLLLLS
jgi:hypothetical protein